MTSRERHLACDNNTLPHAARAAFAVTRAARTFSTIPVATPRPKPLASLANAYSSRPRAKSYPGYRRLRLFASARGSNKIRFVNFTHGLLHPSRFGICSGIRAPAAPDASASYYPVFRRLKLNQSKSNLGTVAEIRRYPVKSMAGESLRESIISPDGLVGDRGWAVCDADTGKPISAKHSPRLLMCAAQYMESPTNGSIPHVRITLPDGAIVQSDHSDANAALSALLEKPVVLKPFDQFDSPSSDGPELGAFFDVGPYHLLTTSSIKALAELLPNSQIDIRRFRPNIYIKTPAETTGFVEFEWEGLALNVGVVAMTAGRGVPRCGMTVSPQPDLPKDPEVIRAIADNLGKRFGIYAATNQTGTVSVGDVVQLAKKH